MLGDGKADAGYPTCSTCKYYVVERMKVTEGRCRRFPPQVNLMISPPNLMVKSDYPAVNVNEWCGEWKPKIAA